MEEIEARVKGRIGRNPDGKAVDSVWTEKGWERIKKMYFVSPTRREIDALRALTENLDGASVGVNKVAENGSDEVALLSYPEPAISSLL